MKINDENFKKKLKSALQHLLQQHKELKIHHQKHFHCFSFYFMTSLLPCFIIIIKKLLLILKYVTNIHTKQKHRSMTAYI